MFNSSELEQINMTINEAEKQINKMEALERLRNNKDFQLIIEKGYFIDEASRLVLVKADANLQEEGHQKSIDKMITAVGYFRQYLSQLYQTGNVAKRSIEDHRNTRTEIMAEVE